MEKFNKLWCEKYRPKTLKEMVLSEDNRKYFSSDRFIYNESLNKKYVFLIFSQLERCTNLALVNF
jgi:hypothetical protein